MILFVGEGQKLSAAAYGARTRAEELRVVVPSPPLVPVLPPVTEVAIGETEVVIEGAEVMARTVAPPLPNTALDLLLAQSNEELPVGGPPCPV